jgi:hypothetical protein
MQGAADTILKARLCREPAHPRALPALLEAMALWQGLPVRAALAVDAEQMGCDSTLYRAAFPDMGSAPLYTLDWAPAPGRRRKRSDVSGMGDFRDLRQLLLFEVAR